jgi:hypothetical protein
VVANRPPSPLTITSNGPFKYLEGAAVALAEAALGWPSTPLKPPPPFPLFLQRPPPLPPPYFFAVSSTIEN